MVGGGTLRDCSRPEWQSAGFQQASIDLITLHVINLPFQSKMNANLCSLVKVCQQLGVEYRVRHPSENLLEVIVNNYPFIFANWSTPLNPQSVMQICQDKDYFYSFFHDVIRMPETLAFLDPGCDIKYQKYCSSSTISGIIDTVESRLSYPLVAKKNRGSYGRNVFKVTSRQKLEQCLIEIFNRNSCEYDYVCCIQEYIDILREYRAVFLEGSLVFLYEKVKNEARFIGNLSPLHWEGGKARLEDNEETRSEISNFSRPLFDKLMIPFCGLDIAIDINCNYYLIEANSSPGFDHILDAGDNGMVHRTYELLIKQLKNKTKTF
jgi:glutathione synthase/RimK-type ligase-like ATP-grasp enzyme